MEKDDKQFIIDNYELINLEKTNNEIYEHLEITGVEDLTNIFGNYKLTSPDKKLSKNKQEEYIKLFLDTIVENRDNVNERSDINPEHVESLRENPTYILKDGLYVFDIEDMIEVYKNLAENMTDDGYQIVMFTHQDVKVWSELTMILWSAGLKVASAWNISTETNSGGLKEGNYVKGTVLLVLQKQTSDDFAFQDEVYDEIQIEVKNMIDSMKGIDYKDIPDFTDADYLLASNAAALKVLTGYGEINDIDIDYWLAGNRSEESPVEKLIKKAREVANSYLIPDEFEKNHWFELSNAERYFIRGLELEMNNEHTIGAYQELAKGFGVKDYKEMFHNFEANNVRLKSPSEYKMNYLDNEYHEKDFNGSLLRHLLVAIYETTQNNSTATGRTYLKGVFNQSQDYWHKKPLMIEILTFISKIEMIDHMEHWHEEAKSAKLLREALKNEGV
jgi:adenine-specific DNA methylase